MGYLVAIIIIFTGLLMKKRCNSMVAPEVLFCFFWGFIALAASLKLFGLIEISMKAWLIILIGTFSYVIGCQFKVTFNSKRQYVPRSNEQFGFISESEFWILTIILIVLLARQLSITLSLLSEGYTMVDIRAGIDTEIMSKMNSYNEVFLNIKSAFEIVLMASGIELYFNKAKNNWLYLFVSIFFVLLNSFSDGGRWIIIYFLVDFVVCYFIYRQENIIENKNKNNNRIIPLIIVIITMITMISSVTKSRMVGNTLVHFYSYLCCCVPLLDIKTSIIMKQGIISGGMASQWGIWSLFVPVLKRIFGVKTAFYDDVAQFAIIGQNNEFIGTGYYNAFVSAFYYLYVDFRWLGVIFGMIIFGIISRKTYDYALKVSKGGSCVPYLVICQLIIKSNQNYLLTSSAFIIAFVILIYFWKRRSKIQYK